MVTNARRTLAEYLALQYPYEVIAEPEGGYVIRFPNLPGCVTQAETADEIGSMAEDARRAWIGAAYDDEIDIPLPSSPER